MFSRRLEFPDMLTLFVTTREIGEGAEGRVRKVRQQAMPAEHRAPMLPCPPQHPTAERCRVFEGGFSEVSACLG